MTDTTSEAAAPAAPHPATTFAAALWAPVAAGLLEESPDLAEDFHRSSSIDARFPGHSIGPWGSTLMDRGPGILGRKALATTGDRLVLPDPGPLPLDFRELVRTRQSRLSPTGTGATAVSLGALLGLSAAAGPRGAPFRIVPSGGGLHPLDVVPAILRGHDVPAGGYVYDPVGHALIGRDIDVAGLHASVEITDPVDQPDAWLAIVATFARTRVKYGLRGYRFALMEAGHLCHALLLAAQALGLHARPVGGFADAEAAQALDIDGVDRACLYLLGVSWPGDDEVSAPAPGDSQAGPGG